MEQSPVLILIIPMLFALVTPIVGMIRRNFCFYWVLTALAASLGFAIVTMYRVVTTGTIHYYMGNWAPPWGIEYVIDPLNSIMLVIITGVSLLVTVFSLRSVVDELPEKVVYFYTVFLLQVVGFLGIVITGDLFNLYVFLEIASITGYALIAAGKKDAPLASYRYIIMGTVGASFYMLGVGYLYVMTGTLNMADLAAKLPALYGTNVVKISFAFFMTGIAIKMALFPLHSWLPDAYSKAPSVSSALIAPLMTKISIYIMFRVTLTVFKPDFSYMMVPVSDILLWLGTAAIAAGGIMSLAQKDFKRMLCFIIVAEVGYMVGGFGLANETALKGAVLHILNDAVMTLGLFLMAGIVVYKMKESGLESFKDMFKTMPVSMTAFVVTALSIIGVPPTCGFFSKWYLLQGAFTAGQYVFAGALLLSSLINVVLFFRIFEISYGFDLGHDSHGRHEHEQVKVEEAPLSMIVPSLTVAAVILAIGLFNQAIISNLINNVIPEMY